MNYEKLSGSIRAVIDRRPGDNGAYSDLFSLCREWETEDFSAAHKVNKELLALSADQVVRGGGVKFYEQWRRCLLFEAPHDFDSFMTYRSVVVTPLGEISTFCRGRACSRLPSQNTPSDVVSRTLLAW